MFFFRGASPCDSRRGWSLLFERDDHRSSLSRRQRSKSFVLSLDLVSFVFARVRFDLSLLGRERSPLIRAFDQEDEDRSQRYRNDFPAAWSRHHTRGYRPISRFCDSLLRDISTCRCGSNRIESNRIVRRRLPKSFSRTQQNGKNNNSFSPSPTTTNPLSLLNASSSYQ